MIRDNGLDRECPICGREKVCSYEEALTVYRSRTETVRAVKSYERSGKDMLSVCTWCLTVTYRHPNGDLGRGPPSRAYYRGEGDSEWGPWTSEAKGGGYGDLDELKRAR